MSPKLQDQRLAALRERMSLHNLSAYLIPKSDEFQLEYVPRCNDRLAWLTDFTGSAGLAIVGTRDAALFTDGRYTEQAQRQTNSAQWQHRDLRDGPAKWLNTATSDGDTIGYNPRVHTPSSLEWANELARRNGLKLRPVEENLVDEIWDERPAAPRTALETHPLEISGETANSKRQRVAKLLKKEGVAALIISAPANWAWLLNLRAQDLEHTPLALGFCILEADGDVTVFLDESQWSDQTRAWVTVSSCGSSQFESLNDFGGALTRWAGKKVRVARSSGTEWIVETLRRSGATPDIGDDPCTLAKACKSPAELTGITAAHIRDGVALTRFLHWLDTNTPGNHTEWTLAEKLDEFRKTGQHYRSLSFRTISAFGPSAASPHYTVTREIARPLSNGNVYLVDSGGQYVDGTTDVTRVAAIGTPTTEMQERYTQVLRGHIALARAQFPSGTTGHQLDPLARQFLWDAGVDYSHGTGHGVGCFLSVHEGPQSISPRPNSVALRTGMILSNEPGYYKPGHFGIRIENLVAVEEVSPQPARAEAKVLGFRQLTLCPYERTLILSSQMRPDEVQWVNDYHEVVLSTLSPLVPEDTKTWLEEQCAPLS